METPSPHRLSVEELTMIRGDPSRVRNSQRNMTSATGEIRKSELVVSMPVWVIGTGAD